MYLFRLPIIAATWLVLGNLPAIAQNVATETTQEGWFESVQFGIHATGQSGNIYLRKDQEYVGWGRERLWVTWRNNGLEVDVFEGQFEIERINCAAALGLPDGNTVVAASVMGCDYGLPAPVVMLGSDGTVLWEAQMANVYSNNCQIFPAESNSFYVVFKAFNSYNFTKYNTSGAVLESGTSTLPLMGAAHPDGAVVLRDNALALIAGNNIFVTPWMGTTSIRGLHTLPNGEISIFDEEKWYRLNGSLQPVATIDFTEQFEAVSSCNTGFLTVVRVDSSLFLQRYDNSGELTGIYDLDKHLYDPRLLVRGDTFFLGATHFPPNQSSSSWDISGPVDLVGQWTSEVDLAITGIQLSGIPEAKKINNLPPGNFSVDYSGVFAVLENVGTVPISRCQLKFRENACMGICPSEAQHNISLDIPIQPGETQVVYMDYIAHPCVRFDVRKLCIFATATNFSREANTDNNRFCTNFPDIVPVEEASALSIKTYPNPATETVMIELPDYLRATDYRIWDMEGRLVRVARFSGPRIEVASLVAGTYRLELLLDNGQSAAATFLKH